MVVCWLVILNCWCRKSTAVGCIYFPSESSSLENRSIILGPRSKRLTSAPVWKSKCSLPTYPSHKPLRSSFRHPSNVPRSVAQSITLCTCPAVGWGSLSLQQCPKEVSLEGTPCLLQNLMAEFIHNPLFSPLSCHPSATTQVRGHRGWVWLPRSGPPTRQSHWGSLVGENSRSAGPDRDSDRPESRRERADCTITIGQQLE